MHSNVPAIFAALKLNHVNLIESIQFAASRMPWRAGWLVGHVDEIQAGAILLIHRYFIKHYGLCHCLSQLLHLLDSFFNHHIVGASFTENFYGLKRVPATLLPSPNPPPNAAK